MPELSIAWPLAPVAAYNFILILTRVGAAVGTAPVLGGRSVPMQAKLALTLLVSLVLLAANWQRLAPLPGSWAELLAVLVQHLAVGLLLGFATGLVFAALQMAGQLVGLQVGFALADTVDPVSEFNVALLDQFYNILAALIFLAIDGHHWLMLALLRSFDLVPLTQATLNVPSPEELAVLTANVPALALQVAFPVMAALVVADVALGILVRIAPQINVFVVGMPLKVAIGLVAMAIALSWPAVTIRGSLGDYLLLAQRFWE